MNNLESNTLVKTPQEESKEAVLHRARALREVADRMERIANETPWQTLSPEAAEMLGSAVIYQIY
jgi:DICT domain-containing protein